MPHAYRRSTCRRRTGKRVEYLDFYVHWFGFQVVFAASWFVCLTGVDPGFSSYPVSDAAPTPA